MQLRNRTISTAEFDQLHAGMRRLAKYWDWQILDEVSPDDPSVITLRHLGLEQKPEPEPLPELPDDEPTLEQWIAAGYLAENYERFVASRRSQPAIDDDQWDGNGILEAGLPDVKA